MLRFSLIMVIIFSTIVLFSMQHAQFKRAWRQLDSQKSKLQMVTTFNKRINLGSSSSSTGQQLFKNGGMDIQRFSQKYNESREGERQFQFDASMIERKDDQVMRKESISYTHTISEKKVDESASKKDFVAPKVAFMFITKGVIHNEPSWRAFFEAAARLQLSKAPPNFQFKNVEELYGQLHTPLETLREDQYPGWKILHGIIDPMTFKFLDMDKDIPAWQLAELIVDPIRYSYDIVRDADRVMRKQILKLLETFRGQMVKANKSTQANNQPAILFPDIIANNNLTVKQLLSRADFLEKNNTLVTEQEYYIQQFVELLQSLKNSVLVSGKQVYDSQTLFSLYVHPLSGYFFPKGSLFEGRELLSRVNTSRAFAQHAMVEAEIALLKEALRDQNNFKFVLLSENCVPLHTPEVVWTQLMSESSSRVDACRHERGPLNLYRWKKQMRTESLSKKHWRKSQQWFVLNRPHAELITRDQHVAEMFKRYCWSYYDPIYKSQHVCISDEHVIPTLLATYGLDFETDCLGMGTYTNWMQEGWHPKTYKPREIRPRTVRQARGIKPECNSLSTVDNARKLFEIMMQQPTNLEVEQNSDFSEVDKRTLDHQEQIIASMQERVKNMIESQKKNQIWTDAPNGTHALQRDLKGAVDSITGGIAENSENIENVRIDDTYTGYLNNEKVKIFSSSPTPTANLSSPLDKDNGDLSHAEKLLVGLMNRKPEIARDSPSIQKQQLGRDDPTVTTADMLQQDYLQQVQSMFLDQQKQMLQEDIPDAQKLERIKVAQTMPTWIKNQGYQSLGPECSLFARKFPPQAVVQTLRMVLDCEGVGLGHWCYQHWLDKHSAD